MDETNGNQQPSASPRKCSREACTNRGSMMCTRCKANYYCSQDCQKHDWRTGHKQSCIPKSEPLEFGSMNQSANCFVVRATGLKPGPAEVAGQLAPLDLKSYGSGEAKEQKEIRQRLGWTEHWGPPEAVYCYGHEGDDTWYYYVYGQAQDRLRKESLEARSDDLPKGSKWNGLASLLTDGVRDIYGDVALVRSGPASLSFEESFRGSDLEKTVRWSMKGRNVRKVYLEREESRARRMYFGAFLTWTRQSTAVQLVASGCRNEQRFH